MTTVDLGQRAIDAVFLSNKSFTEKMDWLATLEPVIVQLYQQGLTQVKPACLMTADDLVS